MSNWWGDGRDDRWRDGYDAWKTRGPDYDDEEEDRYDEEDRWCPECGERDPDGTHELWCSAAMPTLRVRLYRAWHWHIKHWRVWRFPSIYMVTCRVWHWWHFNKRMQRLRKWLWDKPVLMNMRKPDDDIPF